MRKELLDRIKRLSPISDQKEWKSLKEVIGFMNKNDLKNKEIFEEAKNKGL